MKEGRKAKQKKKKKKWHCVEKDTGQSEKKILVANTEKNPSKKISNNTGL